MPPKTQTASNASNDLKFVELDSLPARPASQGRRPSEPVQKIMQSLKQATDNGKATGMVLNPDDRTKFSGYVRSAGKQLGFEVRTLWYADKNQLVFGKKDIVDKLVEASKKSSAA